MKRAKQLYMFPEPGPEVIECGEYELDDVLKRLRHNGRRVLAMSDKGCRYKLTLASHPRRHNDGPL